MPAVLRPKVLVVEDDPLVRGVAVDYFVEAEAQVIEASDAEQALELLPAHPETMLVFCDVRMPGKLDGLSLAMVLRARYPNLKVALTSGNPPDAAFGFPYISKPWRRQEIVELVRSVQKLRVV